jgi:histone-lysine N-methyltransferase SETMAR
VRPLGAQNVNGPSQNDRDGIYWDILDHPPYSPDLAISDLHLFLQLKKHLTGKKFDDDDEVQEEFMSWFKGQTADFYASGIQKSVPRLNKCLVNAGECVEK